MNRAKDQTPVTSRVKNGSQEPDNDVSAHEIRFFYPSLCRPAENNVSAQAKSPAASHILSVQFSQILASTYSSHGTQTEYMQSRYLLLLQFQAIPVSFSTAPVKMLYIIKVGD